MSSSRHCGFPVRSESVGLLKAPFSLGLVKAPILPVAQYIFVIILSIGTLL